MSSSTGIPLATTPAGPKLFKCLPVPRGDWKNQHEVQCIKMVLIHNIIIRGYNSILYYSGEFGTPNKRFKSFLAYCAQMNYFLHGHHHTEETLYFPFLEGKLGPGSMKHNVEGHDTFKIPFAGFESQLAALQVDKIPYDVQAFRDSIYAFAGPLFEHLAEEVESLRPDTMHKAGFTTNDFIQFDKTLTEHLLKSAVLSRDPQIMLVNGDARLGGWFPQLPAVIGFLVKRVLWYKHTDIWAFGSCNSDMIAKPPFEPYEPELEPEHSTAEDA